jgi:hypothetical protein
VGHLLDLPQAHPRRVDAATIRRCREVARAVDLEQALDEELARLPARA